MDAMDAHKVLGSGDPDPVEVLNPDSRADVLLVCEHAGRAVPARLGGLGVSPEVLNSHRGWDVGAASVSRRLAEHLNAPLVLQNYSRLVLDANRPPGSETSIPEISHGAEIPANRGLTARDARARVAEILDPMDAKIERLLDQQPRRAVFSIHSFTPELAGVSRPWHAGMLTRRSIPTADLLIASLSRQSPDLVLAVNQPYQIDDEGDWFIPHHAEPRDLPHSLIEIRNDQIAEAEGAAHWAQLLAVAITDVLEALP